MSKPSRNKVLFVYANAINLNFVHDLAVRYNIPITEVVETIIDAYRTGKAPFFTEHVPAIVEKAEKWKKKYQRRKDLVRKRKGRSDQLESKT